MLDGPQPNTTSVAGTAPSDAEDKTHQVTHDGAEAGLVMLSQTVIPSRSGLSKPYQDKKLERLEAPLSRQAAAGELHWTELEQHCTLP